MGQRYNIIYQNISIPNKDKYNTNKIEEKCRINLDKNRNIDII